LKQKKGELVNTQHVLSQPIWLNPLIKIGGNTEGTACFFTFPTIPSRKLILSTMAPSRKTRRNRYTDIFHSRWYHRGKD
jgi:hypothetical protein